MTEATVDPADYPNHDGVAILGELSDCAHARWAGRWPEILDEAEHAHFWHVRDTYEKRGVDKLPMAFLAASLARAARPVEYAPAVPSMDLVLHGVSAPLRMIDAVGKCAGDVAVDTNLRLLRLKAALIAGDVQMCSEDRRASIAPYVRLIRGLAKSVLIVASDGPYKAVAVAAGYTAVDPRHGPPNWAAEGSETYADTSVEPKEVRSWFTACGGRLASLVLRGETSFASILEMVYGDRLNRARVVTGGYYYRLLGIVGSTVTALPRKYWKGDDDDD